MVDTRRVRRSRRRREREAVASQRSDRSWKPASGMVSKQQEPTAAQHSTAQEEFQFPKRSPTICVCSVLCLEAARIPTPTCTARPSPNCTALPGKQLPHFLDCRGERAKTQAISITRQCNATQLSTWIPQSKTAEAQFSKTGQHTKQDGELKHKFILSP